MTCNACGFENPAWMKFCGECATPLASHCASCGCDNPPGFKYCGGCGAALKEVESRQSRDKSGESGNSRLSTLDPSTALRTGSRLASSPRAYTPRHLAEKILNSRSALEGERKQVTVLFSDVKGSM